MAVQLDQLPPVAMRPARPRLWLWLALLLLFLLAGTATTLMFGGQALQQQSQYFWVLALGVPLLGWGALVFVRGLLFFGQHRAADGWDEAREADWLQRIRVGRRSQQVLSASLYTALRKPDDLNGSAQLDALLCGTTAFKAQPSREGAVAVRHSRLASDADEAEAVLLEALTRVLADLASSLKQVPENNPLALLLEVDCGTPADLWQRAWQQAWAASGIRQTAIAIEGSGLAVVDQWLDQRISDQALLLVVALQIEPSPLDGTGEAAVGLLFGNRLTQRNLAPIAYLHRPEQERELSNEALLCAVRQSLDWVPVSAQLIEQTWRVGVGTQREAAINTVLNEVGLPAKSDQGLCHLDALLGQPGRASPWLAIAAATQTIERGAGPQFICSGDSSAEAGLWSTVLMPVPPLSE
ncbi:hypothetical protein [Pseudomonas syringae]|uniref:Uncharacterized protein n=1 Tax=Pseudomonas syringae TaxID=317 RepID=A0A085V9F6_PSESX|nr:hypothetical protein [Pseudomonas syringae]KFE52069.1 hypothetical protein IV01_23410 [Pseudomonas syringae]